MPVAAHARYRRPVDLRRQDVGAVGDLARNLEATTDTTIGDRGGGGGGGGVLEVARGCDVEGATGA